jgi:hypothetical protein
MLKEALSTEEKLQTPQRIFPYACHIVSAHHSLLVDRDVLQCDPSGHAYMRALLAVKQPPSIYDHSCLSVHMFHWRHSCCIPGPTNDFLM